LGLAKQVDDEEVYSPGSNACEQLHTNMAMTFRCHVALLNKRTEAVYLVVGHQWVQKFVAHFAE